jgi:hypothetical protein
LSGNNLRVPINPICNEDNPLVNSETWIGILEPELCKDSAAVESLARLLFIIKKEINSGPEGVIRASEILTAGIELMYLYTDAHKAAVKLYLLSLTGHLKPQDEPLHLINDAIRRGMALTVPEVKKSAVKKTRR